MLRQFAKVPGVRRLWSRFPVGSVDLRTEYDIWDRPAYAFGIHSAARLARALGLDRITAVEFGVAGGNGLVSMERIAEAVGGHLGVDVAVMGFDAGSGMPAPEDYRDLPHVWAQGFYKMDAAALRARLRKAELVLGNVADTVRATVAREGLPPIGFVSFDLDYYSSTMSTFHIFGGEARTRLPRVYCYFDDLTWPERPATTSTSASSARSASSTRCTRGGRSPSCRTSAGCGPGPPSGTSRRTSSMTSTTRCTPG